MAADCARMNHRRADGGPDPIYPALQLVRMHMPVPTEEQSREALLHRRPPLPGRGCVTTFMTTSISLSEGFS
jgi:hypothetical protein